MEQTSLQYSKNKESLGADVQGNYAVKKVNKKHKNGKKTSLYHCILHNHITSHKAIITSM